MDWSSEIGAMRPDNNGSDISLVCLGLFGRQDPTTTRAWGWLLLEYDYVAFGQVSLWVLPLTSLLQRQKILFLHLV